MMIAPALTLAAPDLTPGEDAVVANTNGDGATLRTDPGRDAAAITNLPEGTPLQIVEGASPAPDGSLWYPVVVDGVPGYISADFVERGTAGDATEPPATDDTAEETSAETEEATESDPAQDEPAVQGPAASTIPWQEPVAVGVVVNTTGNLPVDGITCRADAADSAPIITELWEGNGLEITGEQVFDGAGGGWYPINCAGVGGFVSSAYVAVDAPAEEEPVVDEQTTEEVTEEPVTEEPAVEEPVTTEVVEEVVSETATTEVDEEPATEVVTEETAPVEEVTTEETVETVTEEVVEEPAAPVEEAVTETEPEVVEETTTDTSTTTDTTSETETDTETPVVDEVVTETATDTETETETDANTDSTPVEETVEVATETVTETETTTETEGSTETETSTETATEGAPEVAETAEATAEATVEATTPASEPATEAPATPAPTPVFDESKAIGTAEVQGTGGAGLKCHTAADSASPTITVLPEGANVIVMAAPRGDWLNIVCGERLGFAQVRYLYSGGAAPSDFSADDTGGTVRVQGTGGGGLNCRSSASTSGGVITLVPEGSSLTIRGVPQGSWLPVVCAGRNGYVYVDYVSAPVSSGSTSTTQFTTATSGTATVANTNGDGVRCRSSASTSGSIITVLSEGTRVTLRGTPSNGWAPVVCAGRNGYVSSMYLKIVSSGTTSGGTTTSGTATVTGTGSGLNCRAGAGTTYRVITILRDNTVVTLRGAASGGWQPVVCAGQNGFVSSQYLRIGSTSGGTTGGSTAGAGTWATVSGTGGRGVYCRTRTTTLGANIMIVREGQRVLLRGTPSRGWAPVICGGRNGYISLQYLTIGGTTAPAPPPPTSSGMVSGDHAKVMANLNLRYQASTGSGVAAVAPAGTVVLIRGSATNGFYPVNWDGLLGYMSAQYLTKTTAALSQRGGSGTPLPSDGGSTSGGSASGNAIVSYAMGYQGYPYRWATHGPSSFDCSGFTYWVIKNVVGKDIGYGLWTQANAGTPVSRSQLQPGDLVFFQNTYKAGLSHVGIYIGNNRFIHAQNESTGVVVSDLSSTYYGSRWYGAVRIT